MFKKKGKQPPVALNKFDSALPSEKKTSDFHMPSEAKLRKHFEKSDDVFFQKNIFREENPVTVTFVACEGMIDRDLLNHLVFERVTLFFEKHPNIPITKQKILDSLHLPQLIEVKTKEQMIADVFSGSVLVYLEGYDFLLSANIANRPQRSPEETSTEVTVKGPRDNFIEDLSINTALIRKRLRTDSLHVHNFEVGKRSLTKLAVLYIEDIANPDMVQTIFKRIEGLDVDGIYSGNQFMELIDKSPSMLLPRHQYTGRPDFAVECLLKGRIAIVIDGVAYSMIVPINSFVILKTGEDNEYTSVYASFERVIRLLGIFVAAMVPGFWVALTTFHQDQIPLILLSTVVESRRGLPFPTAVEAIIMVMLFEIFKEAGMRLPASIGGTLSVLGALIIGDAAIQSGLTSPAMLVVIAGSSIATYTLVNQSIIGVISVLRIVSIIFSAFLGLFGYMFLILFLITYLGNIRILGVPYIEITANLNLKTIIKALFRIPAKKDKMRPASIFSKDSTEKGSDE